MTSSAQGGDGTPALPVPLVPELVAALVERGLLDTRTLPLVAAHWLADGVDVAGLAELAGLHGTEPELTESWRELLPALGIDLATLPVRRTLVTWTAERVLTGAATPADLVRVLWPDDDRPDDALDTLVHQLDDAIEHAGNLREEAESPPARWRLRPVPTAELLRQADAVDAQVARAVASLVAGDLAAAGRALAAP